MSIILDGTGEKYHARIQPGIRELIYPKTLMIKMSDWNSDVAELVPHEPPPWTGEGLPPVGIEIEAFMMRNMHDTYEWRRAKVVHGGIPGSEREILVFDLESTSPAWVDEFRPIRTPEQIAAEEREAGIFSIIKFLNTDHRLTEDTDECIAAALWDAGYRKQVAP